MLQPRLIYSCSGCSDILTLIDEIDCKLVKLSSRLYNNTVFILNQSIPVEVFIDLLIYRRILQYKYVNSDYAKHYSIDHISSKVKFLKYK